MPAVEGGVVGVAGGSTAGGARWQGHEPVGLAGRRGARAGAVEPVLAGRHGAGDRVRGEEGEDVGEEIQGKVLPHGRRLLLFVELPLAALLILELR